MRWEGTPKGKGSCLRTAAIAFLMQTHSKVFEEMGGGMWSSGTHRSETSATLRRRM
jgi:hypothetical protein